MRQFWTQGPVNAKEHYVVARSEELADYIDRVKQGRYIVLFAPRQTGKTTFFQNAIDALEEKEGDTYLPIQLNFEAYVDSTPDRFYPHFYKELCEQFDYRQNSHSQIETETVEGYTIYSYVIPVLQNRPSESPEML